MSPSISSYPHEGDLEANVFFQASASSAVEPHRFAARVTASRTPKTALLPKAFHHLLGILAAFALVFLVVLCLRNLRRGEVGHSTRRLSEKNDNNSEGPPGDEDSPQCEMQDAEEQGKPGDEHPSAEETPVVEGTATTTDPSKDGEGTEEGATGGAGQGDTSQAASSQPGGGEGGSRLPWSIEGLSEEEELQLALSLSLSESAPQPPKSDNDEGGGTKGGAKTKDAGKSGGEGSKKGPSPASWSGEGLSEEEELQLALSLSLSESTPQPPKSDNDEGGGTKGDAGKSGGEGSKEGPSPAPGSSQVSASASQHADQDKKREKDGKRDGKAAEYDKKGDDKGGDDDKKDGDRGGDDKKDRDKKGDKKDGDKGGDDKKDSDKKGDDKKDGDKKGDDKKDGDKKGDDKKDGDKKDDDKKDGDKKGGDKKDGDKKKRRRKAETDETKQALIQLLRDLGDEFAATTTEALEQDAVPFPSEGPLSSPRAGTPRAHPQGHLLPVAFPPSPQLPGVPYVLEEGALPSLPEGSASSPEVGMAQALRHTPLRHTTLRHTARVQEALCRLLQHIQGFVPRPESGPAHASGDHQPSQPPKEPLESGSAGKQQPSSSADGGTGVGAALPGDHQPPAGAQSQAVAPLSSVEHAFATIWFALRDVAHYSLMEVTRWECLLPPERLAEWLFTLSKSLEVLESARSLMPPAAVEEPREMMPLNLSLLVSLEILNEDMLKSMALFANTYPGDTSGPFAVLRSSYIESREVLKIMRLHHTLNTFSQSTVLNTLLFAAEARLSMLLHGAYSMMNCRGKVTAQSMPVFAEEVFSSLSSHTTALKALCDLYEDKMTIFSIERIADWASAYRLLLGEAKRRLAASGLGMEEAARAAGEQAVRAAEELLPRVEAFFDMLAASDFSW
ncbi:hypothetical protein Efla_004152 [Eimeria flavescens]